MIKLSNLLKEIEEGMGGKSVLWGYNDYDEFMELIKLQGFSTSQEALDEINELYPWEDPYELGTSVDYPSYAYLSGDGQVTFVKDLSEFSDNYQTEEGWGVTKWSKDPPL
jgi:hypothetical protein